MALLTGVAAAQYSPLSGILTRAIPGGPAPSGGEHVMPPHFGAGGIASVGAGSLSGTPASTAASGSMGPISVGGSTPDWAALIKGDPGLIEAKNSLDAGDISSLAQRDALIKQAYVNFGDNIDFQKLADSLGMSVADVQNVIGQDTQRLAQENTQAGLSTQAQLQKANSDAILKMRNALNARGILNSGETGYEAGQQDLGYRQAQSDATKSLLGYLQQYQQGYLSSHQSYEDQLAQQYSAAADRVLANNQGTPATTATFDHIDASGQAVYRAPDGSLYLANGSAYTPQSQPMSAENTSAPSYPTRVLSHLASAAPAPISGGTAVHRLIGS